jgi:hypothetical protein
MDTRSTLHSGILLLALAALLAPAPASGAWALLLAGGGAANLRTRLEVDSGNAPAIRMRPRYEARPFEDSPYYAARLSFGSERGAWELELVHHKLYLRDRDRTPEISNFEATHGYNLITLGRSIRRLGLLWRAGLGVALVHLEGTVRGAPIRVRNGVLGGSYSLEGPAGQIGIGKPLRVSTRVYLSPEAALTAAYARVSIDGGRVTVPNLALHGRVGLGYVF